MVHLVLYALLAIIVAGGLFLLATRFLPAGEQIAPPLRDEPVWDLPAERDLRAEDIDTVRLPVALRGYRFAETDVLLDRLAGELRARDAEIARLRSYPVADEFAATPAATDEDDDGRFAPPAAEPAAPAEPADDDAAEDRPTDDDPDHAER